MVFFIAVFLYELTPVRSSITHFPGMTHYMTLRRLEFEWRNYRVLLHLVRDQKRLNNDEVYDAILNIIRMAKLYAVL